jgi:hypothetical protein
MRHGNSVRDLIDPAPYTIDNRTERSFGSGQGSIFAIILYFRKAPSVLLQIRVDLSLEYG